MYRHPVGGVFAPCFFLRRGGALRGRHNGSEGRREQTFKTDQDNALIYSDTEDERAGEYFTQLAAFAQEALAACGYPPCTGNFMASNPQWRQPLSAWIHYFRSWISGAERRGTEDALILFDMRPVAGDFSLFEKLAVRSRCRWKPSRWWRGISRSSRSSRPRGASLWRMPHRSSRCSP